MWLKRFVVLAGPAATIIVAAGAAYGQASLAFPSKPLRIVTSGVGGGSDFDARIIAQGIASPLGQPVIVDNRAVGALAAEIVAKAPADGHSMLVNGASLWLLPFLRKAPYEVADFAPITLVEWTFNLVAVHPSVPAKSVKELIDLARAKPGEFNYGSTAVGGRQHLATELLKSMAGVNIVNVPYKGNALAVTGLVGGEVHLFISDIGLLMPQAKSGKVRALAVTSATPTVLAPGIPTVAATGLPGYEATGMTGIWATAKTPQAVINRLNREIVQVLMRPEVRQKFLDAGLEVVANSPSEFAAMMKADMISMGKVIKDANIRVQ